ncbi:hypothetical protein HUT06_21420 [Actinomadura sp. NAK00032]|uniref:hypothetical protein n=1 Tax=Actinomadura sp. NAK00032 TaxID=2742128 RepID=UPI00158FFDE9|nr:hypothetical protein [Actinomadura sp. NAK00032]QKW36274.1 hypothetical protein HUT06_21420 [Actinomadura sp. NAK00032]
MLTALKAWRRHLIAGDDAATYEDLMRQTQAIYRKLHRSGLMTSRQFIEERDTVEAAMESTGFDEVRFTWRRSALVC